MVVDGGDVVVGGGSVVVSGGGVVVGRGVVSHQLSHDIIRPSWLQNKP